MNTRLPLQVCRSMTVLVLLLGAVGCATNSDVQKMGTGLSSQMDDLNSSMEREIGTLRDELTSVRAEQEKLIKDLSGTLEAVRTDSKAAAEKSASGERTRAQILNELKEGNRRTRQMVVDYASATNEAFEKIAASTAEIVRDLREVRQSIVALEHLPPLVTGLGAETEGLKRALLQSYQLEEVALKERLKTLQQLNSQMQTVATQPKPEATAN